MLLPIHFCVVFFCFSQITRILDDSNLEKVQHCLVGKMPNTYTMTKKCSENLVNHKAHGLPAGIFRPPIGNEKIMKWILIMECSRN